MAVEQSLVLLVGKDYFMRTVGEILKKSNMNRIELIHKLPLFCDWQLAQLASLYRHAYKKDFNYSNCVYKQDDTDDNLYILLSGEIEVLSAHPSCSILSQKNPLEMDYW